MRCVAGIIAGVLLLAVAAIAGTITFSSPKAPPLQASGSAQFQAVEFTNLPLISRDTARDGTDLAYRRYAGNRNRLAILLHGAAGSGIDMRAEADAFTAAGAMMIIPDIRGHGLSGSHGDIAYIGQLEDDLEDLMTSLNQTHQAGETTLR